MLDAPNQTPSPQEDRRDHPDLVYSVFDQQRDTHLDAETLETALSWLLTRYPEAPVFASGDDGAAVPIPDSIPLKNNPVLEARTGMDLIVPADRVRLVSSWDKVLKGGAARSSLHPVSDPELIVTSFGLDLREKHGVILAVFVPANGAMNSVQASGGLPVISRFARVSKDDSGIIVKIDEAATHSLGWSPEEMVGRRSVEFIHPDDRALAIDNWLEMLVSPGLARRVRLRHRRRDGSWVWFDVMNNNLLDDPDYRCVVCDMVDVSEEMAREQLLARLAETVPVGLFQLDADRRVVYTNDQLRRILGVEGAITVEAQLATIVEDSRLSTEQALEEVLAHGHDTDVEVEVRLPPSGRLRFCTISLRALTDGDGTISGAIACVADVTDSTRMREELKRRATFDELTGCYNRPSIMQALEADIASGEGRSERAVMFVDLDRFKHINDQEGHAAGDELLKTVAAKLRGAVRADDLVGRIGGDEFLIVCPEIGGCDKAMKLAERIARTLREDLACERTSVTDGLTASVGVAWSKGACVDADLLVAQADNAMYESKHERVGQPKLAPADSEIVAHRSAYAQSD